MRSFASGEKSSVN